MTYADRKKLICNGQSIGFKTVCTGAVLRYLGIYSTEYRYAQTISDTVRIIRNKGYYCHSRKSKYKGTVSQIKLKVYKERGLYLVWIKGHVLLINFEGYTIIDTSEKFTKGKQIKGIWLIKEEVSK